MAQNHPMVHEDRLVYQLDGRTQEVMLGTPEWYAWLAMASTFTFRSTSGTFTARKERAGNQRGGWYWKAYRKHEGKLFSAYIGKSESLTIARLHTVAARLNGEDGLMKSQVIHANTSEASALPALSPAVPVRIPQVEQTSRPVNVRFFNLPAQLTPLVGREQDTAQVCALLLRSQVRLLTLLGPGGVGKTRLALAAAAQLSDEFANGVVFVSLAPIRDPHLVIAAIAHVLGLHQGTLQDVQRFLQDRHLLLVLDNVEQVASAAPLIEGILFACPQIKALITSRAALHLQGEQEFPVPPLSLPDLSTLSQVSADALLDRYAAVALFVQRAQALRPQFQLTTDNVRPIADICIRLDGLPLAIELAAARIKLLPPQALLARLTPRLTVLTGGARTVPERQRTLLGTLQWSYDLLNADEQRLFRRVSVFVSGCTLEAIAAVCGAGGRDQVSDALGCVSALLDHSLLFQMKQEGEEPRLAMLETVREYALDCLEENGETEAIRRDHARYYLTLAEEIAPPGRRRGQQLRWLRRLTEEQENLRAALGFLIERREAELAVQLSGALWWYWVNRGSFNEGRAFLAASLSLPHSGDRTPARARALCGAGELALRQGNYQVATALLEESVASYREVGETRGLAQALLNLGLSVASAQRFAEARTLIEQSIALSREMDDPWLLGHAQDSLARLAWKQGDLETTRVLAEQGLQLAPQLGELRAQISPRKLLATVALVQGDYNRAADLASALLAIARSVGDRETECSALFTLGTVALRQGDHAQASDLFNRCLNIASEIGSARNSSMTLARLGEIACEQGNYALASERFRESLSYANAFEDKEVIGGALLGLARVAKAEKHYGQAAHLLGAAEGQINVRIDLDALARLSYEREVVALRTYLGKEAYTQAWDEGSQMTLEQILTIPEPAAARNASPMYPDELTEREVEVLRLVASGLTDTQVAEQLVISPRTVQGHLRSIYSKIRAHSRSAATRYAVERNLL
jgi:predicted ATPase/DNA-binding CsgD family transcriptional regulator/Tfp pilus assembly protein PilF